MGIDLLVRHAWAAYLAWAALFVADYVLTVWGARLMTGISDRIVMEGSYELNPFHAPAIDAGRRFSARALLLLVLVAAILAVARLTADTWVFEAVSGTLICVHVPLIVRHLDNVSLFKLLARPTAADGRLRYRRWAALRLSAWGMAVWAGVFGLLALLTWRVFFVGGAFACLVTASAQRRLAGKFQ